MLTSISFASLRSDQLFTWSDEYTERIRCRAAKTPRRSCASTSPAQIDSARLAHRAIQAMWQAGVQMRRWAGTRPQVLSVGSHPGQRPQMDYVPQDAYGETVEFLANYHRSREILETICEINRELLRRREAL